MNDRFLTSYEDLKKCDNYSMTILDHYICFSSGSLFEILVVFTEL